jgi:hypothetical protein
MIITDAIPSKPNNRFVGESLEKGNFENAIGERLPSHSAGLVKALTTYYGSREALCFSGHNGFIMAQPLQHWPFSNTLSRRRERVRRAQ